MELNGEDIFAMTGGAVLSRRAEEAFVCYGF